MGKKLIITAALCGAGTTKKQTPCVPITPEEIAADAVACAAVLHYKKETVAELKEDIRAGGVEVRHV